MLVNDLLVVKIVTLHQCAVYGLDLDYCDAAGGKKVIV